MQVRRRVACRTLSTCAAALLILGCGPGGPGLPDEGGRCGTEVPDPTEMVVGCLVDESDRPAPGIIVHAAYVKPLAKEGTVQPADTVVHADTTDSQGRFSFNRLKESTYIISAQDDTLRSMPSHKVMPRFGVRTELGKNTLYRNGFAEILLQDRTSGQPLPSVFCGEKDMLFAAQSGVDGRFNLVLPPGDYTLACATDHTALVASLDSFGVSSAETTTVTISLVRRDEVEARPLPPKSVTARYDQVTGIVHLSWPRITNPSGGILYFVKRTDLSIGSHAYSTFFTSDTFHSDVIPWPKDEDGVVRTKPKAINYNVGASFLNRITLSRTTVDTLITVHPPLFLGPEVEVNLLGDKTTFLVGDTARLVGSWRNPYRENLRFAWTMDSDGSGLKPMGNLPGAAGSDTLAYPCTSPGRFGIRFKVTDQSGAAASALQVIDIDTVAN